MSLDEGGAHDRALLQASDFFQGADNFFGELSDGGTEPMAPSPHDNPGTMEWTFDLVQQIMDFLPIGVCILVPLYEGNTIKDWTYAYINEKLARINGKKREEHAGKTISHILPSLQLFQNVSQEFVHVFETGKELEFQVSDYYEEHAKVIHFAVSSRTKSPFSIHFQHYCKHMCVFIFYEDTFVNQ